MACRCEERKKPVEERQWFVVRRKWVCSAFDGYKVRPSKYSHILCKVCHAFWRTKAKYVDQLEDYKEIKNNE